MSNLKPSLIGLDKGLNLQTSKIAAPSGSVLDMINYEQVDFQGQKRIDGFLRYDGSITASLDDFIVLELQGISAIPTIGSLVASDSGMFGLVVSVDNTTIYVAVNNSTKIPVEQDDVYTIVGGQNVNPDIAVSVKQGVASGETPDEHYERLLAFNNYLREKTESLPGPIAGLHWFRAKLHAIAGVTYMSLNGTSPQIFPQDVLESGGVSSKVLDSFVLGHTRAVFLDSMTTAGWESEGAVVTRDGVPVGTVANGYEDLGLSSQIATIFEARTEQQVLDEDGPSGPYDFGWRMLSLGWQVLFENGTSLYGDLPSINQNVEGIGVQGPTSTTGSNGKFLSLTQDRNISGEKTQVSGWKSSQTPTIYSLLPSNLEDVDGNVIYADAYITWKGNTDVVSSPGLTTSTLTERDPAATVEVEIA